VLLLDVNVLVYAFRDEMVVHPPVRQFLNDLASGRQSFGVPQIVLSGFVRVVTQPRVWDPPTTPSEALDFCRTLCASPRCLVVHPGENHWAVFDELCRTTNACGNLVADAYLAAYALERDDTLITTDKHFAKFPGLRWRHPLSAQVTTNPR